MKKTLLLSLFVALTIVATAQTQRTVLLEHFTQASCGPCASINPLVKQYLDGTSTPVVPIKYQTSWPGFDPMNLHNPTQVQDRVTYYGVSGVPDIVIDGNVAQDNPATLFSGGQSPTTDARSTVGADFEISALHGSTGNLSDVDVNVIITAKNNVNNANLVAHVVIVEKEIAFSAAPGSNGETEFYNVMKQMLPSSAGTALAASYTTGQTVIVSETWGHSNVYKLDDVAVVVFIQDINTKEVLQAAFSENIDLPAGIQNADLAAANPASLASGDYCDGTYIPAVDITNNSNTNLATVDVSYELNGSAGPVQTIALNAGQTSTVTFPGVVVANGDALAYNSSISDAGFGDLVPINNNAAPAAFVLLDVTADNGVDLESNFEGLTPFVAFVNSGAILDNPDNIRALVMDNTVVNGLNTPLGGNGASSSSFWWDFYGIQNGSAQLVFEEVDFSGALAPVLNFTYAHAQYQTESDRMIVKISSDCGATWEELFNKAGSDLSTVAANTARFFATANDWEDVSIPIINYAGMSDVVIAFEGISAYGNSLFLDDINTTGVVSTENVALETSLNIFPNPAVDNFNVSFELTETADLEISLVSAIGQTIRTIETGSFVAGEHMINVNTADLATGTYFVTIRNGAGVTTKTITVQK
jgi:hypothetical protein